MSIYLLYALLSSLFVGTSDFLSRLTTVKYLSVFTVLILTLAGTILMGIILISEGCNFKDQSSEYSIPMAIAGMINAGALLCLFEAIKRGPVSVAAPLATLGVLFLTIIWFFNGVIPSYQTYLGVLLSLIGAMFVGYVNDNKSKYNQKYVLITAIYAVVAAFLFSVRLFIMQYYASDVGHYETMFWTRLFGFILMIFLVFWVIFINKDKLIRSGSFHIKDIAIPSVQGILETIGILLLLMASVGIYRVTAPAIFSFVSVVTIFWAVIIFKEKISILRLMGIIILLSGIIVIEMN